MRKKIIVPIVEGYGEERAVPCLIRQWLRHRRFHNFFDVHADHAINAKGCGRLKARYDRFRHLGIEHYVQAAMRLHPDAIIVILDADEECLKPSQGPGLGPKLLARAKPLVGSTPISVVVANREYEAWFLANISSLRSSGMFPNRMVLSEQLAPERPRDCKGIVSRLMGRRYEETIDQLNLTKKLPFSPRAAHRSPSFGKLLRDLETMTRDARKRKMRC